MTEITKKEFTKYEKVRKSGVINMMDIKSVRYLTSLSKDKILAIMKNYGKLSDRYTYGKVCLTCKHGMENLTDRNAHVEGYCIQDPSKEIEIESLENGSCEEWEAK